jgi:general L-amino acid transport system substrate-binding protein
MINKSLKFCLLLIAGAYSLTAHADIFDDVRNRGKVRCGVNTELVGFSKANSLGEYAGFDIDLCRAVATALFNNTDALELIPVNSSERFEALQSGALDLLARNTTWTLVRNARFGDFVGVNFYDGQGFMVRKRSGIRTAIELDNVDICVGRGTTSELNAADFFSVSDIRYKPVFYEDVIDAINGYLNSECAALTTDRSALAAQRTAFEQPDAHIILPDVISKEPLGPVVPKDGSGWENVVRWSLNCMINAEELGVTSATPAIRRLIGTEGNVGEDLGLDSRWCARIIRQVGNYGEIYERHIGQDTAIGLPRGVNALWTNGGLIYAPPIR